MAGLPFRVLPTKISSEPWFPSQASQYDRGLAPACPRAGPRRKQCLHGSAPASSPRCSLSSPPPPTPPKRPFKTTPWTTRRSRSIADLKDQAGTVDKPLIKLKQEADTLLKSARPGRRRRYLCADRHRRAERRAGLAAARRYLALHPASPMRTTARRASRTRAPRPISPISARPTPKDEAAALITLANAFGKRDEWRSGAERAEARARARRDAGPQGDATTRSARNTASVSPISASTPMRKPARLLPVLGDAAQAHRLLRLSCRSRAKTSPRSRSTTSSSASKGLSTATPIPSRFAQDCPRRSTRACSRTPTSPSMCATGARRSGSSGKAYVLPRTGQQGIPLVTVNTD